MEQRAACECNNSRRINYSANYGVNYILTLPLPPFISFFVIAGEAMFMRLGDRRLLNRAKHKQTFSSILHLARDRIASNIDIVFSKEARSRSLQNPRGETR